jgi:hypothetical protein
MLVIESAALFLMFFLPLMNYSAKNKNRICIYHKYAEKGVNSFLLKVLYAGDQTVSN